MWNKSIGRQAGLTMVELIVAMVIVAIAIGGLIAAVNSSSRNSADPVVLRQMASIAEGTMEEVLLVPYDEAANAAGRVNFNDIWDYRAWTSATITDVEGTTVPGLNNYGVSVTVANAALGNVPAERAARITVTATYPGYPPVVLQAWRTRPTP